jgi:hypothetical protein
MKFTVSMILTALLAFALCLQFPWWMIAVAAFVVAFAIPQKPARAFLCGTLAIFLLWCMLALWIKIQAPGGSQIAGQVARLLPLGGNPYTLIFLTGFVGSLVGGLAALSGSLGRKAVFTRS